MRMPKEKYSTKKRKRQNSLQFSNDNDERSLQDSMDELVNSIPNPDAKSVSFFNSSVV